MVDGALGYVVEGQRSRRWGRGDGVELRRHEAEPSAAGRQRGGIGKESRPQRRRRRRAAGGGPAAPVREEDGDTPDSGIGLNRHVWDLSAWGLTSPCEASSAEGAEVGRPSGDRQSAGRGQGFCSIHPRYHRWVLPGGLRPQRGDPAPAGSEGTVIPGDLGGRTLARRNGCTPGTYDEGLRGRVVDCELARCVDAVVRAVVPTGSDHCLALDGGLLEDRVLHGCETPSGLALTDSPAGRDQLVAIVLNDPVVPVNDATSRSGLVDIDLRPRSNPQKVLDVHVRLTRWDRAGIDAAANSVDDHVAREVRAEVAVRED